MITLAAALLVLRSNFDPVGAFDRRPVAGGGGSDEYGETPDELGAWFGSKGWALRGKESPLISVSYARAPMLRLSFEFGNGFTATRLDDDAIGWSGRMAFDKLSDDIRKATESAYDEAAATRAKDDVKGKGQTIPPR